MEARIQKIVGYAASRDLGGWTRHRNSLPGQESQRFGLASRTNNPKAVNICEPEILRKTAKMDGNGTELNRIESFQHQKVKASA